MRSRLSVLYETAIPGTNVLPDSSKAVAVMLKDSLGYALRILLQ